MINHRWLFLIKKIKLQELGTAKIKKRWEKRGKIGSFIIYFETDKR